MIPHTRRGSGPAAESGTDLTTASIRDFVDQSQARAILHLKAEIVRVRSFGQSHLYKFWAFKVDEITDPVWTDGAATTSTVWLTTDYGLLDGTG